MVGQRSQHRRPLKQSDVHTSSGPDTKQITIRNFIRQQGQIVRLF